MSSNFETEFKRVRHIQYFVKCLKTLPSKHAALDTNRLTMVHFAVQSLEILGFFDSQENLKTYSISKEEIIEWIYSLQVISSPQSPPTSAGFIGGSFLGLNVDGEYYNQGHLAMTYSALCTLITLGDDLKRVHRNEIISALKYLQLNDGSFQCVGLGSEYDLRFVYCACAICHILEDWSGVDQHAMIQYIYSCKTYDGALSLVPGQECHGGSTYCGIASLALMGALDQSFYHFNGWKDDLIRWCVSRQIEGMQGRPNKLEDTCYSYWIGATLKILDCENYLDRDALRCFVLDCQSDLGGFSKVRDEYHPPDLLHSFYSLAWLSFSQQELNPIDCMLGMSRRHFLSFRKKK